MDGGEEAVTVSRFLSFAGVGDRQERRPDLEGDVVAIAVVVDEAEVPVLAHVLVDVHDGRDDVRVPRVHVLPQPRPVVVLVRVEW